MWEWRFFSNDWFCERNINSLSASLLFILIWSLQWYTDFMIFNSALWQIFNIVFPKCLNLCWIFIAWSQLGFCNLNHELMPRSAWWDWTDLNSNLFMRVDLNHALIGFNSVAFRFCCLYFIGNVWCRNVLYLDLKRVAMTMRVDIKDEFFWWSYSCQSIV